MDKKKLRNTELLLILVKYHLSSSFNLFIKSTVLLKKWLGSLQSFETLFEIHIEGTKMFK